MNRKIVLVYLIFFANILFAGSIIKPENNHQGFIENKGQIIDQNNNLNPAVLYLFNSNGLNVQLRKTGFSYDVWKMSTSNLPAGQAGKQLPIGKNLEQNNKLPKARSQEKKVDSLFFHRIDFEFENANADIKIISENPSSDYTNYYTTGTPEQGVTNVRNFQKVMYKNVWNGIDIEFLISDNKPKYNIILQQGAKLSDIKFRINGADNIDVSDGKLILQNSINDITEAIPYSFYTVNGNKKVATTSFTKLENNLFTITTNEAIPANAVLTIDPLPDLLWGTYYGYSAIGQAIANDTSGNVYITGYTSQDTSATLATSGAYQTSFGGHIYDAFIVKFNSSGSRIWATYYGGNVDDYGQGISIDASGNITSVGNITTVGAASYNIGTSSNYYNLVYANGFGTVSDKRLKREITNLNYGLKDLMNLRPVSYYYNQGLSKDKKRIGFIAQELKTIIPEAVFGEETDTTFLSVSYSDIIPVLVNAIKEQQQQIEQAINSKNEYISALEKRIDALENKIGKDNSTGTGKTSGSILYQNEPNPFGGQTTIRFYIPNNFSVAKIVITDNNSGATIKEISIINTGSGTITVDASQLNSGSMYTYSLVVDNKIIDTKKMILLGR